MTPQRELSYQVIERTKMIDYQLIGKAVTYYKNLGYKFIDVPWYVSMKAIESTLPPGLKTFSFEDKYLVGSAEQSFVQLMLDGEISSGKYVAVSPCFRDEIEDELHKKSFMKVELISIDRDPMSVIDLYQDAFSFFKDNMAVGSSIKMVNTEDGFDICINGIEVGSYGRRQYENFYWSYGTGLAEPRFSNIKESLKL